MFSTSRCRCGLFFALLLPAALPLPAPAEEGKWLNLSDGEDALANWKKPTGDWFLTAQVAVDTDNPKLLKAKAAGQGTLVNGPKGRTSNLLSKQSFGDLEAHVEFLIPKGSNSGVKFEGLYEIQIFDSFGVKQPTGSDCGGIYPRAELLPKYHHIDDGVAPRSNAARPAGEWQTLDVTFRAPRFDDKGKKTASARFVKVVLNGTLIHDDVEVKWPTGNAWHDTEVATGPLLLQADHGPVAFRNIRVRPPAATK